MMIKEMYLMCVECVEEEAFQMINVIVMEMFLIAMVIVMVQLVLIVVMYAQVEIQV